MQSVTSYINHLGLQLGVFLWFGHPGERTSVLAVLSVIGSSPYPEGIHPGSESVPLTAFHITALEPAQPLVVWSAREGVTCVICTETI